MTLNDIIKPQEGKHLGDLCGWSLSGAHMQTEVRDLAKKHGLEDDLGLPFVSPSGAYRRAVKKAITNGRVDERTFDAIKIDESDAKIVHSIVRREITASGKLTTNGSTTQLSAKDAEFHTEAKTGFDKEKYKEGHPPENLLQLENPSHVISGLIAQYYDELCVRYISGDIRIAFQRAFAKWGAMPLLKHGGMWWVPQQNSEKVRAWQSFMIDLKCGPIVIPIFDTEETIRSLREQSKYTLEAELEKIIKQLEGFTTKDNTRISTLDKRIEQFDTLRDKIDLHAAALGNKQKELIEKLDLAHKGLVSSLSAINEADE